MASLTSNPVSLSRYKPAVIAITVLSAAYVVYLLRQQTFDNGELPAIQNIPLHRSNAIRRNGSRRRRRSATAEPINQRQRIEQAVAHALLRGRRGEPYGIYTVRWDGYGDGEPVTVELLIDSLSDMQTLRGADWPDGLWEAAYEQYPRAFFRAFLREEFSASLSNEDAAELRSLLETGLDAAEYLREIANFNSMISEAQSPDQQPVPEAEPPHNSNGPGQVDGPDENVSLNAFVHALERQETIAESEDSDESLEEGADHESLNTTQNMMDLLYHIGGEQARRAYYVHRGVQCNSCGAVPIQGIRYHCINCYDYDLCESCEAGQVHIKTHVLLKIRLPGPTRGDVKDVIPPWYPGRPEMTRESLPHWVSRNLLKDVKIDKTELDALYDQFRSLAGATYDSDPLGIGMAIDRAGFDQYFAVTGKNRHSAPLLVHDRIFALYDTNNDGLIDFEEFVKGLTNLQDESRDAKLRRIFRGYDLDDDGYVDRKDFLRMFRSYYAYMKEINRDIVAHLEEDISADGLRELLESSQPISAAFTGAVPHGHDSRAGSGKVQGEHGDMVIQDELGVLKEDCEPYTDRDHAIAAAALAPRRSTRSDYTFATSSLPSTRGGLEPESNAVSPIQTRNAEEPASEESIHHVHEWPPADHVDAEDIIVGLGREVPLQDITDPLDRSRVLKAQADRLKLDYEEDVIVRRALGERWRRRRFYVDQEEGMSQPPGYGEEDSSEDDQDTEPSDTHSAFISRRPSMRSRSSSKVRFEDSLTDNELETRSNTSSRSIPMNERWGGFEISEGEREIGKEILYQTVQQTYNDLLDILFKEKEDLYLMARQTRLRRHTRAEDIRKYAVELKEEKENYDDVLRAADMLRTEELFATAVNGDARLSPRLNIDPDSASIASHNALIESAGDLSIPLQDDETTDAQDPTMPQFRPDHETSSEDRIDPTFPQNRPDHSPALSSPVSKARKAEPKPELHQPLSRPTLATFLAHNAYDLECKERGGAGKISFDEFAAKMVENQGDEVEKVLGRLEKDKDIEGKWPKSAGLGKLDFIGSWLHWASF